MLTNTNREVVSENIDSPTQENILYIGDTVFFHNSFHHFFRNCQLATDFSHTKQKLKEFEILPNLIIIDIPLNHFELVAFKVWTRANEFHKIPIIYNQSELNALQIKQLFSQKLVDDVVSLEDHYKKLPYKLKFLEKLNNHNGLMASHSKNNTTIVQCKLCLGNKILDKVISTIAIIFCLPIFIIIAIIIKIESKGPIFYCAERAGKGFKVFKFFKFRTMILNADKNIKELENLNQYSNNTKLPTFFKLQDDPRVTKFGSFLRKTSLDELPQLFNVLIGDMSIVGNRPLPLYEASTLTTDAWAERFMAPAGITGLWQVSKRGKEEMSNEERILLDINYARTRSLKGDLKIILQTPAALVQKTNV
jgi:lipopolysaccharide/colanic/teichoic acid biosynthesis glycosyltransferase